MTPIQVIQAISEAKSKGINVYLTPAGLQVLTNITKK